MFSVCFYSDFELDYVTVFFLFFILFIIVSIIVVDRVVSQKVQPARMSYCFYAVTPRCDGHYSISLTTINVFNSVCLLL